MAKDPYKDSPYDASGMPLGVNTVDYDNQNEVAKATVKDKYVAPLPLFSDDDAYEEPKLERTHFNAALNNTAIQAPGHKIHKAHAEDIGFGIPQYTDMPKQVDLEKEADNPDEKKDVKKALDNGEDKSPGKEVKKEEDKKEDDSEILKLLKDTDNDGK